MQVTRNTHSGQITMKCTEREGEFFLGMLLMIQATPVAHTMGIDPWTMYRSVVEADCNHLAQTGRIQLHELYNSGRLFI